MKIALFPGSFDPFTLGHYDLLKIATRIFDKVIVAVGYNHQKRGFLTIENRLRLINDAIAPLKAEGADIEVASYSGLTADFCRKTGASFIVRGVRNSIDFDAEATIARTNSKLLAGLETIILPSCGEHIHISSTVVRDITINGGDPSDLLPENIDIKQYLNND
jgi:pantetheine-phosphate adenylyltransferase